MREGLQQRCISASNTCAHQWCTPMIEQQAGCLGGLPISLQQAVDTASRKLQCTTRNGNVLRDFAVIADQSQNDALASASSKPTLTRRAPNKLPSALIILAVNDGVIFPTLGEVKFPRGAGDQPG